MDMVDLRQEYNELQSEYPDKATVLEELDDLISDYDVRHETSLKDPFLIACFERIDPERNWEELVRTAEDYENWWGTKKRRATALRLLMTLQIGWPEHKGLLDFEWKYLVGILFAIKASDSGINQSRDHAPVTYPPDLDLELLTRDLPERTVPDLDFPTLLTFSIDIEHKAEKFLENCGIDSKNNNHHVVYIIDCTPEVNPERSAITSIRHYAQALHIGGKPLNKREAAAMVLNESQSLLYVGSSHEFPKRMKRHFKGKAAGAANFINLYKPKRLLETTNYSSDNIAESEEQIRASELQRQINWLVYQN
jgi:predicted GIY-YIG superfamily endonuclease